MFRRLAGQVFSLDAVDGTNAPALNGTPISKSATTLNIPDSLEYVYGNCEVLSNTNNGHFKDEVTISILNISLATLK
jgi:hypothetical protein